MEKPQVTIASSGPQGNTFAILGEVKKALRGAGRLSEFEPLCAKVYASGSYTQAIAEIRTVIDLCDTDGII